MKECDEKEMTENEIAEIVVDAAYGIPNGLSQDQP